MKLVIDLTGFTHGKSYGYEEYIFNILHTFVTHRDYIIADNVYIACHESEKKYIEERTNNSIEVIPLRYHGIIGRLLASRQLPKILSLGKEDLILYSGNTMPFKRPITKTLLVVHDLITFHPEYCSNSLHFRLYRLHKYFNIPRSIKYADEVIAISQFTKDEIISKFGTEESKIDIIYNYFDFDKYYKHSGLNTKDTIITGSYILTVCSSVTHKNHITLLKAFNKIAKKNQLIKFVIVGSLNEKTKDYYTSMSQEIKGRIVFLKNLSNQELANVYINAKAYISASLYEGLGMPVVEAMFFGLPTFLSDIKIHREVSFSKAYYFAPFNYSELADLLEKNIYKKPATVKNLIVDRYSEDNTSLQYIKKINSLLNTAK